MPTTIAPGELRRIERSFYDAMVGRDRATLDRLLHDDVTYIHSNGRIETKKECMDLILSGRVYTSVESAEVLAKELPGVGVLTCKVTLNSQDRPPNHLLQTQVWSEFPDGWKMVLRSSTKA